MLAQSTVCMLASTEAQGCDRSDAFALVENLCGIQQSLHWRCVKAN